MERKYRLLDDDTIVVEGHTLYRIEAVRDFYLVRKGDRGGYVEKEWNLSHLGDCWIYDEAMVYGGARVSSDATVKEYACVHGSGTEVFGSAIVRGGALVCDCASVCGYAIVRGYATIRGLVVVGGYATIMDADIRSLEDFIVFKNWWSSGRYFTWTRSNDKWSVGCFHGSGEDLIRKAYEDSERSGREYERIVKYVGEIRSKEICY